MREHSEARAPLVESHVDALQQTRFARAEALSSAQHARVRERGQFAYAPDDKRDRKWRGINNSEYCIVLYCPSIKNTFVHLTDLK